MAIPVPYRFRSGVACVVSVTAPVAWVAIVLCGCSINLGSLSSSAEREEPAQLTSQSNIASLTEAIKNNPNDPQAYNMRGSVLAQAGRTEEALADFNKAVSLDANDGQAFANRGLIYRKTRRFDQALDDYNLVNTQVKSSEDTTVIGFMLQPLAGKTPGAITFDATVGYDQQGKRRGIDISVALPPVGGNNN